PTLSQDRVSFEDRLDLQDSSAAFAKLPPAKAIPPPSDDVSGDPDYANSLPILPAQPQQKPGSADATEAPGDKPVYVVHFVLGDKDGKGQEKVTTTTKSIPPSTSSAPTTPRTTASSTTTTTTTTTTPAPRTTSAEPSSQLDPHSPEFADMLNQILNASKNGFGRSPQFVVFAPMPGPKRNSADSMMKATRYDMGPSTNKQQYQQEYQHQHQPQAPPPPLPPPPPTPLRVPIRPREEYQVQQQQQQQQMMAPRQPFLMPPPQQPVLMRRNGSNPNPFQPPPPPPGFQANPPPPPPVPEEPPQPGFQSVGGYSASRNHETYAHGPQGGPSPFNPPPPQAYAPPPRYDPVDSQRGLLHPSSESAYPHKDRSGFEIHAGDSYGGHSASSGGGSGHGKGITFTIGGGHGDGGGHHHHDYGVSPMGVIKNLFLPFLPKPKVNLNGRVVFGVVLEKGVGLGHNQHGHHQHAVAYHH
ncbi:unnamed protein product, partial [Ixodes hexagonus]